MTFKTAFFAVASVLATATFASACTGAVKLDDRPCPCATGWTCCPGNNTCVGPGLACPVDAVNDNDGGTEAGSPATHLLAKAQSARCLTTDATYVYWANVDGQLVRAPIAGGDVETSSVVDTGPGGDRCGLAIQNGMLFGTQYQGGHVFSVDLTTNQDGTFGATVNFLAEGLKGPASLVVDATSVYVANGNAQDDVSEGSIVKLAIGGTIDHNTILTSGLSAPDDIVADDVNVYWLDTNAQTINSVAKSGGMAKAITPAPDMAGPQALALHGGRLYWATALAIMSANVDGSDVRALESNEQGIYGNAIAVDDSFIYWGGGDGIHKLPIAGGTSTLVSTDSEPATLAIDATRVYWSNAQNEIWTALK